MDAVTLLQEPNNLNFPENCAHANYSQRYGAPQVWGFTDANCAVKSPFMCRISGGAGYKYNATSNNTFIFTPGGQVACIYVTRPLLESHILLPRL